MDGWHVYGPGLEWSGDGWIFEDGDGWMDGFEWIGMDGLGWMLGEGAYPDPKPGATTPRTPVHTGSAQLAVPVLSRS